MSFEVDASFLRGMKERASLERKNQKWHEKLPTKTWTRSISHLIFWKTQTCTQKRNANSQKRTSCAFCTETYVCWDFFQKSKKSVSSANTDVRRYDQRSSHCRNMYLEHTINGKQFRTSTDTPNILWNRRQNCLVLIFGKNVTLAAKWDRRNGHGTSVKTNKREEKNFRDHKGTRWERKFSLSNLWCSQNSDICRIKYCRIVTQFDGRSKKCHRIKYKIKQSKGYYKLF